MKKYASYNHLSRCKLGDWQGLVRGSQFNIKVTDALDYIEDHLHLQSLDTTAVVHTVHLADFLFHKIKFPEDKSRRVRAIKNKVKMPRSRFSPAKWFSDRRSHIKDIFDLLKHPLREEGENTVDVGPFTLQNPINLSGDKVEEMVEACTKALTYCTNSLAPNFTQALYGDVVLVEKLGRASWYAWYNSAKDEVTLKHMGRDQEEFMKTFIHEIGHRYYRKNLSREKKSLWRRYDSRCHMGHRVNLNDFVGKDIGLYAKKNRTKTTISSNPSHGVPTTLSRTHPRGGVYLVLPDGSEVGAYKAKYIKDHLKSRSGLFPTNYATSDVEEHFCEALAYKAVGKLHPKSLDAFNSIVIDGQEYTPNMTDFTEEFTPEENVPTTQVEETLPSKQQMIQTSESLASRLGLFFKKGRKYGLFIYTNQAIGSTHAYMFIDYATGNLFAPKNKSKPNLNVNLANITDNNLDVCVGHERMSSLKPRWRTMNMITEGNTTPPPTEIVDQTPEPTRPTTPESNLDAITEASRGIANALDLEARVGNSMIKLVYDNLELGSKHAVAFIDKTNGNIYMPKSSRTPKTNALIANVLEPNLVSRVNRSVLDTYSPNWKTKFKIKGQ
jgi:hypothetical protein